ncbi:trypsin-like peptidase domain-containing protein, partial [Myxococcota bacterium]|nr:trypsin-like peptidase domain-containing protein [Myxococcota bacterium]
MLNALLLLFSLPYAQIEASGLEILVKGVLSGSGTLIAEGWGLTAAHIVDGATEVEIISPQMGRRVAQVEALDRGHDLALLRLPTQAGLRLPPVAQEAPLPGAPLYLFGAPQSRHHVLLSGTMARAQTTYEYYPEEARYVEVYHVCGPSPEGTSGGGWFDATGALVGVQSARMVMEGVPQGIAYMAPTQAVRALLERRQTTPTASVGVGFVEIWEDEDLLARYPKGARGLIAHIVRPWGPADEAGLKPLDLVTAVDGVAVERRDAL